MAENRYYPQHSDPRLNEDFRLAFDHIYELRDQLRSTQERLAEAHTKLSDANGKLDRISKKPEPGGPGSTKINGLYVKGTPPGNGDTIRYVAATGQFEFGA